MRYRKHRSVAIAAGALAILLAACSGSDEPSVSATPQGAVFPPPTTAAPASTPTPTPVPTPTPTPLPPPPDPTVIPDNPADIDIEYMQAVVDVMAHTQGEIVREAVQNGGFTDRMIQLIDEAYGDDLRDRTMLEYQQIFSEDQLLSEFRNNPGDPLWTVTKVEPDNEDCIGTEIEVDRSAALLVPESSTETLYLAVRPLELVGTTTAWRLDRILTASAEEVAGRACSG